MSPSAPAADPFADILGAGRGTLESDLVLTRTARDPLARRRYEDLSAQIGALRLTRALAAMHACVHEQGDAQDEPTGASALVHQRLCCALTAHACAAYGAIGERVCELLFAQKVGWHVATSAFPWTQTAQTLRCALLDAYRRPSPPSDEWACQCALDAYRTHMVASIASYCWRHQPTMFGQLGRIRLRPLDAEAAAFEPLADALIPRLSETQVRSDFAHLRALVGTERFQRARALAHTLLDG